MLEGFQMKTAKISTTSIYLRNMKGQLSGVE